MAYFDPANRLEPTYAIGYYGRGLAYRQTGEKEKATADFEKVLELSDDPDLRQQVGEQLKALGTK
jgi:tetratricopeptide (TPR) repeat protein